MTQVLTTPNFDPAIIEQKRVAWSNMGEAIYKSELQLHVRAQAAALTVELPTSMDHVPAAEIALKSLKAEQAAITTSRKEITSKLDDVTSRLMLPEKSLAEPIKTLETAIIKVKKEDAQRLANEKAKLEEKRLAIEYLIGLKATTDATFKRTISDMVSKAYDYALGDGNVTLEKLDEYTEKVAKKLTESDFSPSFPARTFQHFSQDDYKALVKEHYTFDATTYVLQFITDLETKFSDYEVALQNKEDALALSRKQQADNEAIIQRNQATATASASLFSGAATIADPMPAGVKELKQAYEVDMPETPESVLAIWAAFSANRHLCMPKLKVNKWFAFTPAQAATALAKVKNDDNAFQPSGIIFKVVDKL